MNKVTKYKINITRDDIVRGIPGDPCRCMIARRIRRTLGTKLVKVYPNPDGAAWCYIGCGLTAVTLPTRANKKALRFDMVRWRKARAKAIKPFSFTLYVPVAQE